MNGEPFAVSIEQAAKMVGVGRTWFYEHYITAGRITPVALGARRLIVVDELRAAFSAFVAETRGAQPKASG